MVFEEKCALEKVFELGFLLSSDLALETCKRVLVKEQISDLRETLDLLNVSAYVGDLSLVVDIDLGVLLEYLRF